MTMSTRPCSMNGSRLAETVSTHSILSGSMPSLAAMALPISTSKPTGLPSRPFWPNSGWSNLVPMVIFLAWFNFAIVVPASKLAEATGGVVVPLPPPQALSERASAAEAATRRDFLRVIKAFFMTFFSLVGRRTAWVRSVRAWMRVSRELVGQKLGQEVLGAVALRIGEEFLGC